MATPTPLQPRGGLLDMMGQGDSGFAGWLDPRRNAIINFGAGMIGHDTNKGRMAGAAQGLQTGRQQDTAQALLQEERAQAQQQLQQQTAERNQTLEWLKTNYPQYAGLPPAEGFRAAMADMGRAGGGANAEIFFGTPVPFQTEDGVQYGQLGNQGTFRPIPLPEGGQFAPRVTQVDVGNQISVQDQHGNELYRMPKTGSLPTAYEPAPGGGIQPMPGSQPAIEQQQGAARAQSAMNTLEQKHEVVSTQLDRALANANFWTTGTIGGITSAVPGSPAYDLARTLDTIKANIGFEELQTMRDNSPTGGALGQVTERELAFLQSTVANIEQAQSEQQLRENLLLLKRYMQMSQEQRRAAFAQQYGGGQPAGAGAAPIGGGTSSPTSGGYTILGVE